MQSVILNDRKHCTFFILKKPSLRKVADRYALIYKRVDIPF